MTTFDDILNDPTEAPAHPRLREWEQRIKAGETALLELYRPPSALGLSSTKILLRFAVDGVQQPLDEVEWDPELNSGLIQLGVHCIDTEHEVERFALGLRDSLKSAEKEFGNGYFNAVLLDLVVDSRLDQEYSEIADVLKFTYHDQPERESRSYDRCRDAIALGMSARNKELKGPLKYTQDEARVILARAIARYLDERFSVTSRRHLGLLY